MTAPKFKPGDKVRIAPDHWQADLRGKSGVVSDPGDHLRKRKPRWPATYWKTDPPGSLRIVYWIEFGPPGAEPGALWAAEVDEDRLAPA
jgi:hypothetical protein